MGQDKSRLLTPQGETLLQRGKQLLLEAGAKQVLISGQAEQGGIQDNYPQAGPLAGIEAALPAVTSHLVIVLPVDMPLVSVALLHTLLAYSHKHQQSSCFKQQCLPLAIVNPASAYNKVVSLLDTKSKASVWRFCQAINCAELPVPESADFDNANTPLQWQECVQKMVNGQF